MTAELRYHLIVAAADEAVRVHSYATREELLYRLRHLRREPVRGRLQVFVYYGVRLGITPPPYTYLLEEGCPPEPLFTPPAPGTASEDGDLVETEVDEQPSDYSRATCDALDEDAQLLTEPAEEPLTDDS